MTWHLELGAGSGFTARLVSGFGLALQAVASTLRPGPAWLMRAAAVAAPPLEAGGARRSVTWLRGGAEYPAALPVRTGYFDGAIYSSRGQGYASYNEDAVGLFRNRCGHLFGFVLDQAGGRGGKVRGEGSAIASGSIVAAFEALAARAASDGDPLEWLSGAFDDAHHALLRRGQDEVTTAVAAVFHPTAVALLSSGDSRALLFDAVGRVKERTVAAVDAADPHRLTHALGLDPEGPGTVDYVWPLAEGDWVILATDGLFDAGLDDAVIGRYLWGANDAETAVNALARVVLRRMRDRSAKPDNLSLVVARRRPTARD